MLLNSLKSVIYSQSRNFNWKYPYPRALQPQPPKEEVLDPQNIVIPENPLSENDKFNSEYINKNPRNLEQMLLEVKPDGYLIDAPDVAFWNKLLFEKSGKHTSIRIIHNSGRIIASASTQEWSIRKHLKSTIDRNAIINVARVLAQRCLQSGILYVHKEFSTEELKTQKVQLLLQTLEECGLKTEESNAIRMKNEQYL